MPTQEKKKLTISSAALKSRRFTANLIDKNKIEPLKNLLEVQEKFVKDYNKHSTEQMDKLNTLILKNFYMMIENTDLKQVLVKNHNEKYKNNKKVYDLLKSDAPEFNNGKIVKDKRKVDITTTNSNDVVTQDFKRMLGMTEQNSVPYIPTPDEKMQKVVFWGNRLAHACIDEIKTFTEEFRNTNNKEADADWFKRKIEDAHADFEDKEEFTFRQNYILEDLIKREDFDVENCTDPDYLKLRALMKKHGLKCPDVEHIRNFVYCNKIQDMNELFYKYKNNGVINLARYLEDPAISEDDKNVVMTRTKDYLVKTSKIKNEEEKDDNERARHTTSRINIMNKYQAELYCDFNNSVYFTQKYIENFAAKEEITVSEASERLNSTFKDNICTDTERLLFPYKTCSVTVHTSDINLDRAQEKYGFHINEMASPIVEAMTFDGGGITNTMPPAIEERETNSIMDRQSKINLTNDKKNNGNKEKFLKSNSIDAIYKKSQEKVI